MKKLISFAIISSIIITAFVLPTNAVESSEKNNSRYFYDNLSLSQQVIYDAILNTKGGIDCPVQGTVQISFPKGTEITSFSTQEVLQGLVDRAIVAAMTSIMSDHPEFYWLGNYGRDYEVSKNGITYNTSSIKLFLFSDRDWQATEERYYDLIRAAKDVDCSGNTTYEKVKSIHDAICLRTVYASDSYSSPDKYNACGALFAPYTTVCEGYSEAFKLVCALNGIDCVTVYGESSPALYILGIIQVGQPGYHAWNYVKMDDGKWYALDLTWDDLGAQGVGYDFFLVGSQTTYSNNTSFYDTHKATGKIYASDFSLIYPVISQTSYTPQSADVDKSGDADLNGTVTIADAKAVLQNIAGTKSFNAQQFSNADVNSDGKITIADAKRILQYIAGLRTL